MLDHTEICNEMLDVVLSAIDAKPEHILKVEAVESAVHVNTTDCTFKFNLEAYHQDQRKKVEKSISNKLRRSNLMQLIGKLSYPRPAMESSVPRMREILQKDGSFKSHGDFFISGVKMTESPFEELMKLAERFTVVEPSAVDKKEEIIKKKRKKSKPVDLIMEVTEEIYSEEELQKMKEEGIIEEFTEV